MEEPIRLSSYELLYAPSPPREPAPSWIRRTLAALSGAARPDPVDPTAHRRTLCATSTHASPRTHYEIHKRVPGELIPPDVASHRCEYFVFSVIETPPLQPGYQRVQIHLALYEIPRRDGPVRYLEIVDRLVEPELRRGGVGAQLLAIAEDVAGRNGCELIWGHIVPGAGLSERTLRGHYRVRGYEIHEGGPGATLVVKRRPHGGWASYQPLGASSPVREETRTH